MRRTQKNNIQDDSDDESDAGSESTDSDATVYNPKASNKKRLSPRRKRGRRVARKNAKRQRVQDSSDDGSPQPGPSGISNNQSSPNDSEYNSSETESEDSDYGPLRDRKKKNSILKKKGKPSKKADSAKKNRSVNGVGSHKGSEGRLNTSKKATSNDVTFDTKQIESLAQKLVYFLFVEDQKKHAIKRKAITTHVFKDEAYSPKLYIAVIKKANFILKKTFGMELMEVENQKDSYLLINILGRELHDYLELSRLKQQQYGLILYLLTVIFMNGNSITEDILTKCLKPLGIDLTSKKLHPVFGDVKRYITFELVKQMYLSYECISKEPLNYEIKWGTRADQEFDKEDLLKFNCEIRSDTTPDMWRMQYNDVEKSANPKANGIR